MKLLKKRPSKPVVPDAPTKPPEAKQQTAAQDPEPRRIMRLQEVRRLTSLSRSTVWREVRKGRFPQPFKLCSTSIAWYSDEIVAWIDNRRSA